MIFDSPLQHDYEAGVEVRTLLPTEAEEDIDGNLAVADVDAAGHRYVEFWIDSAHVPPAEEPAAQHVAEEDEATTTGDPPMSTPAFPVFGARTVKSREHLPPDQRGANP